MKSVHVVAEGAGVGKGEPNILPKEDCVVSRNSRILEDPGQLHHVGFCKQLGGLIREEASGYQDFAPFGLIKVEDAAEAIQHIPADPAITFFQPAEGAVVDFGEACDFLLGQHSSGAKAHEKTAKRLAWA